MILKGHNDAGGHARGGSMVYTDTTTIIGSSRGAAEDWIEMTRARGGKRMDEVARYVREVYRLAPQSGVRAEFVIVQAIHETGWFQSFWWVQRLNPCGLGITGDDTQDQESRTFPSGTSSARAHLIHLALYAVGERLPAALRPYQSEDPRWAAAIAAGYAGACRTIGSLTGTWATDAVEDDDPLTYSDKLVALLNDLSDILADAPSTPTPHPTEPPMVNTQPAILANYTPVIVDAWLTEPYAGYRGQIRYHNRSWAGIRAIFVHVQEGNNAGTKQHFRVVKASATVLIAKNGKIERLVPESKAPWTNGDVKLPDQVAIALMNRFGWDPNTWSLTIEEEGYSGGLPYTEDQFKATVWQIWDWLNRYPDIEEVHILRHGQVNSVDRPYCPERSPYRFMARIFAALKGATVPATPGAPTQLYRKPWQVRADDGTLWDGTRDLTVTNDQGKKTTFYADKRDRVTVAVDVLNCRQWASNTANLVREALVRGNVFGVLGWVEGEEVDGERRWWVTPYGTRIWAGGTAETPRKAAPKPTTPDDGVSKPDWGNNRDVIPVVLNGNTYFPLEQHGDEPGQLVRFRADTNVRLWAATHQWSPVVRVAPEGSTARVTHWVKGEAVDIEGLTTPANREKWLVMAEGNDPIRNGGRIWSGLVEEVVDIDLLIDTLDDAVKNKP